MPGTKAGAAKARATILERDPDFFARIGRNGGKKSRGGGFTGDPEAARIAGRLGGLKSRRGPSKNKQEQRTLATA